MATTRVENRIEVQRARLRDGASAAAGPLGELGVAVRVLRTAVSRLDAPARDRIVLRVVAAAREAIDTAHEQHRRDARRRTYTQRQRRPR